MASKHQEATQDDIHLGSTEPISGHMESPLTSESARVKFQHSSVLHEQQIQSPLSAKPHTQHLTRQHLQQSMRRWQRLFTIRIVSLFLAVFGACFYCWDHPNEIINLKNRISKIFSEVGTETLSQKELQTQATAYSKQMIKDVFNDEGVQEETKRFFIQILSEQDFLSTISVLLRDLFQRDIMIESVKSLVISVFNDPAVIEQCKVLVGHAISAEENKQILVQTLHDILDDRDVRDHANDAANDTVKAVLNDEEIQKLAAVTLQSVLMDDSLQESSSESLYKIIVGAVTPSVFRRTKKTESETESDETIQPKDAVMESADQIQSVIANHSN